MHCCAPTQALLKCHQGGSTLGVSVERDNVCEPGVVDDLPETVAAHMWEIPDQVRTERREITPVNDSMSSVATGPNWSRIQTRSSRMSLMVLAMDPFIVERRSRTSSNDTSGASSCVASEGVRSADRLITRNSTKSRTSRSVSAGRRSSSRTMSCFSVSFLIVSIRAFCDIGPSLRPDARSNDADPDGGPRSADGGIRRRSAVGGRPSGGSPGLLPPSLAFSVRALPDVKGRAQNGVPSSYSGGGVWALAAVSGRKRLPSAAL